MRAVSLQESSRPAYGRVLCISACLLLFLQPSQQVQRRELASNASPRAQRPSRLPSNSDREASFAAVAGLQRWQGDTPPRYELVLSRYQENIDWIVDVPREWNITIYNKGPDNLPELPSRPYSAVRIENEFNGNEVTGYSEHLVLRYENLAEYTVFSQANPFPHSRNFLDLIRHPELLGPVQAMSLNYLEHGDFMTPEEVVKKYRKHPWYRAERASLRTFNSVYFHDAGTPHLMSEYLRQHKLPVGTNLVAHQVDSIGLKGWIPHSQEVGSFAWGGIFGVHKSKILQHPREVYININAAGKKFDINKFAYEHIWLMLFGGADFHDV